MITGHILFLKLNRPLATSIPRPKISKSKVTSMLPSMNEKQNGGKASHLDSTATNYDLPPVTPETQSPVIDLLDHSSIECSYASHFNAQIAAI